MYLNYRVCLRWVLDALLILFAYLLQTVVFGRAVCLSLLPVAAVCVALTCSAEQGSLFCLIVGIFYCFSGADMGSVTLVALVLSGALAGGICEAYLKQHLISALLFSLLVLLLSDGVIFLLKLYFRQTHGMRFWTAFFPSLLLSLSGTLFFFPISYAIAGIGGKTNG